MKCYKDKERECNDTCAGYSMEKRHDTNCLELASSVEVANRMKGLLASTDISAFYMKSLSSALHSFRETFKDALKV